MTARSWLRSGSRTAAIALILLSACAASEVTQAPAPDSAPLADDQPSTLGLYLAGRHAERENDVTNAARFLRQALAADPDNLDLMNRVLTLLVADGHQAEAAELAGRVVRQQPQALLPNLVLAVEEAKGGGYAAAEKRMAGLPLTSINRVVVPLTTAWALAGQSKAVAAITALKPLASIGGFAVMHDLHAAYINDFSGRKTEAEASYRAVLAAQENPSPRVVEAVGEFFERSGRIEDARALYLRYQAQSPDSTLAQRALNRIKDGPAPTPMRSASAGFAEALHNLAGVLRQENLGQNALIYGRLALALEPQMPSALFLVADILDGQGQRESANALFERVPRESAFDLAARMRVVENLHELGKTDAAIAGLNELAAAYPERVDPLVTLGNILRVKERFPEAVDAYGRAIARLDRVEARHWSLFYTRGIALERSKQWPRAEADFQRALELQPEQPDVLNYLAYSWVEQGLHFERARAMLERAVQLRPNNGYIVDSLGWVLYRKGLYGEAVPYLERAVELQPEDPVILDHLGDAYWKVGRELEARFQWRRALQHKPDPEVKQRIEEKLVRGLDGAVGTTQRGG